MLEESVTTPVYKPAITPLSFIEEAGTLSLPESPPAVVAVIEAFREIHDPAAEPFLSRQLGNPDPELRRAAVLALGATRSPNAIRQLTPVARDPDETVRSAVAAMLGNSGNVQANDALTRLAHDPSRAIAAIARQALEKLAQTER